MIFPDGLPVKTKASHPYSYDPITQYVSAAAHENRSVGTIYTDRLLQWDYDKHNLLCKKHFDNEGQYWDQREPEAIEAFLRDWCDDQGICLTRIVEVCNVSTGYPTWQLTYAYSRDVP